MSNGTDLAAGIVDEERRFALTGAAQAFCNRGIVIACPWEGDLDAKERKLFEALVAAIDSHNKLLPPKVKPLKWQETSAGTHWRSYDALATYYVSRLHQDGVDYFRWSKGSGSWSNVFSNADDAKADAQADYDRLITGALQDR